MRIIMAAIIATSTPASSDEVVVSHSPLIEGKLKLLRAAREKLIYCAVLPYIKALSHIDYPEGVDRLIGEYLITEKDTEINNEIEGYLRSNESCLKRGVDISFPKVMHPVRNLDQIKPEGGSEKVILSPEPTPAGKGVLIRNGMGSFKFGLWVDDSSVNHLPGTYYRDDACTCVCLNVERISILNKDGVLVIPDEVSPSIKKELGLWKCSAVWQMKQSAFDRLQLAFKLCEPGRDELPRPVSWKKIEPKLDKSRTHSFWDFLKI